MLQIHTQSHCCLLVSILIFSQVNKLIVSYNGNIVGLCSLSTPILTKIWTGYLQDHKPLCYQPAMMSPQVWNYWWRCIQLQYKCFMFGNLYSPNGNCNPLRGDPPTQVTIWASWSYVSFSLYTLVVDFCDYQCEWPLFRITAMPISMVIVISRWSLAMAYEWS